MWVGRADGLDGERRAPRHEGTDVPHAGLLHAVAEYVR